VTVSKSVISKPKAVIGEGKEKVVWDPVLPWSVSRYRYLLPPGVVLCAPATGVSMILSADGSDVSEKDVNDIDVLAPVFMLPDNGVFSKVSAIEFPKAAVKSVRLVYTVTPRTLGTIPNARTDTKNQPLDILIFSNIFASRARLRTTTWCSIPRAFSSIMLFFVAFFSHEDLFGSLLGRVSWCLVGRSVRLLKLFSILAKSPSQGAPARPALTDRESKVLAFLAAHRNIRCNPLKG
jgi:hypothetical protein